MVCCGMWKWTGQWTTVSDLEALPSHTLGVVVWDLPKLLRNAMQAMFCA